MSTPHERMTRLLRQTDPAFVPRSEAEMRAIWTRLETEPWDPDFVAALKHAQDRWQAIADRLYPDAP